MRKYAKIPIVFLSIILFYTISVSERYYVQAIKEVCEVPSQDAGLIIQVENINTLHIYNQEAPRYNFAKNQQPVQFRKCLPEFLLADNLIQPKPFGTVTNYLSFVPTLEKSLTGTDIIFPFNYFW